ncbi:MAG: hypothetical protein RI894_735, partial [Bacteroidota bacterium]
AAQIFNDRSGKPTERIYGCVIIGSEWLFLYLEKNTVYQANDVIYFNEIGILLAAFQQIIDFFIPKP